MVYNVIEKVIENVIEVFHQTIGITGRNVIENVIEK